MSSLRRVPLGASGVAVTEVCLGTMTWGVQNTEAEGHAQLDYAVKERGVNFIDTAEMCAPACLSVYICASLSASARLLGVHSIKNDVCLVW